ncbi:hypothetical protein CROQUDRAFT_650002 [Cronartium quercuum f. sp. fusiforme G11]|uniref:RCC1-like domain-containing protein n=1 Tax=Cronartium quercuum f. sp. fusiforme G11 TaxID=708437 RepID=A0A9P6TH77_9BASI|nr:hypothetical protein CROQUDRAFT_650002 [Cronartium quercuum f. sp. fusiforme G11]
MPPRASSRKTTAAKTTKAAISGPKRGRKPATTSNKLNSTTTPAEASTTKKGTEAPKTVGRSKRARSEDPTGPVSKRVFAGPKQPRPLFSAKATRAAFNPLPHIDPLDRRRSERCGNELNAFNFDPHPWLKLPLANELSKTMLIFGSGDMGQMGLGPEKLDDIKKPVIHALVAELTREQKLGHSGPETVACGGMHSVLVDGEGKIWSWGINDNAALGRKTEGIEGVDQEELESRPMVVEGLVQNESDVAGQVPFRAVRVSAGDSVSVAVSQQGETRAWGSFRSNDGLLGFDGNIGTEVKQLVPTRVSNLSQSPVSQIVCGYDHVLALTTDGHVYSWGNGQQHQLGRKIIERRKRNGLTPERLHLKQIVLIGSGGSHSFAVNQAGLVYGWGLNTRGQLGIGSSEEAHEYEIIPVPTLIESLSPDQHDGARVVAIAGGDFHSLFLFSNGEVWAVGSYENSEIGISKNHEAIVKLEQLRADGLAKKQEYVSTGMARRKEQVEAEIAAFKSDEPDDERPRWDEMAELIELEQKAANLRFVPGQCIHTPLKLDFPYRIIDISCGTRHNLAVDEQGYAYSWGLGQSNELGQGRDEDGDDIELVETPRRLSSKALTEGPNQVKVFKCEAGGTHSILIGVGPMPMKVNGMSGKVLTNGS